jgi:hypothetical protein
LFDPEKGEQWKGKLQIAVCISSVWVLWYTSLPLPAKNLLKEHYLLGCEPR